MNEVLSRLKDKGCDIDGALDRLLDDEDLLVMCIEQVVEDPCIETLGKAIQDKDIEEAFNAAHTLKGVSANVGLTPLYDVLCQIVEILRAKQLDGVEELYQKYLLLNQEEKSLL